MGDRVGSQFGNYRLLRLLGQGAFAEVYLGEHLYMERRAALKIPYLSRDSDVHKFLQDEARILARLHHPHIVGIYECGIENEVIPYLVLEYLPNGTLRQRYPRGTRLSLEQIVIYVKQIASALDHAHERGVIHRDIKPENMLLGTHQEVYLDGFDIALFAPSPELLSTQHMAGTPPYVPPEQLRGKPTFASDQYSLGVVAYEWLCGVLPFEGSRWEIIQKHLFATPPPLEVHCPGIPASVETVILKALTKDPKQRFADAQTFAKALSDASDALPLGVSYSAWYGVPSQLAEDLEEERDATQPLPRISSEPDEHIPTPLTSTSIPLSTPSLQSQNLFPSPTKEETNIEPIKLFYCYAPQDRKLRDQLEAHLMVLKRLRQITLQLNREIIAGTDWKQVQDERFHMADLILLLISPDFIKSDYHYGIEMHNALEKHKAGNVQVIPILLRPTPLWQGTPLGTLQMLPKNGKAITEHARRDLVLADIVKTIGEAVSLLLTR